eukprot:m.148184 g.148184  ORF g.148184 m.148184 type:complete len:228 (+) comp17798_c0_seq1:248-931(+)
MKVKRLKRARKLLQLYTSSFGFREPFQILVDGTFCQAALETKTHLQEQIPAYLSVKVTLLTTGCIISEIDSLGDDLRGAKLVAKRLERHKCRCPADATAEECILARIGAGNALRYCVATQDPHLRAALRKIPGVPIISLHHGQLVLDKPSQASIKRAAEINMERVAAPSPASAASPMVAPTDEDPTADAETTGKKKPKLNRKRKAKGPNPLSMRKKSKKKAADKSKT